MKQLLLLCISSKEIDRITIYCIKVLVQASGSPLQMLKDVGERWFCGSHIDFTSFLPKV
jgi:hypothetical protein